MKPFESSFVSVDTAFQYLHAIYGPWIVILGAEGGMKKANVPWNPVPSEMEAATIMVHNLVTSIDSLQLNGSQVTEATWTYLCAFWNALPIQHVMNVILTKLSQLHWILLRLQQSHVALMQVLFDTDNALYAPFLVQVLQQVDLEECQTQWISLPDPENRLVFITMLKLLLSLGSKRVSASMQSFKAVLAKTMNFDWMILSSEDFSAISTWIAESVDATEVFDESSPVRY
jgi:hypothetical protein